MVRACHLIFTTYGFWLPNDPRGSWSQFVGAWQLLKFGDATKVSTPRSLARVEHDIQARLAAKRSLKYPPVLLDGRQARAVGRGFTRSVEKTGLVVYACSIMPDHVHMVIARHRERIETIASFLKSLATLQLIEEGIHPLAAYAGSNARCPKPWARGQWKVFLDDARDIARAIRYVRDNPLKEGKPPQKWRFVREWDGGSGG